MRIDQLLVQRQLASTRSQAQRLIADGVEFSHSGVWRRVAKNGDEVPADAQVRLLDTSEARFVSRGGLKLEAALHALNWSLQGLQCLDVGQSTGGFTDCLLQRGAAMVVGVDVGSAQLHPSLRADGRVLCVEKCNARSLAADDLIAAFESSLAQDGAVQAGADVPEFVPLFDLIVMDLSFISQTLVLPALVPLMKPGGRLLSLVKPQFELQPGQVGKGGVVKEDAYYPMVENRVRSTCTDLGLVVSDWLDSSIKGGDGNREFLMAAQLPVVDPQPT
jgi:23S rRNA (cytidine1920-2'-O)/16S rRNA (cytidine1409-2'-O)-methyltransferase